VRSRGQCQVTEDGLTGIGLLDFRLKFKCLDPPSASMSLDVCCLCLCFRVRVGCGCRILREHLCFGCGYMYVSSCDVLYRSCDFGHPSTEFSPCNSFFHSIPHKPFFKRHLLKTNCEGDNREMASTVKTGSRSSSPFFHPLPHKPIFKRHLLKANCERDSREIACIVPSTGGRNKRNLASGYSHVNYILKIHLPHPCGWKFFVCVCVFVYVVDVDIGF
jgi:hypothetical protein